MFYNTELNNHNLQHNPFKSCIIPRPIAWISTHSLSGIVNVAPYSYFNAVSDIPPIIMFSSSRKRDGSDKDTLRNIELTGEFVVNIATEELRDLVNISSTPLAYEISEATAFGIETLPSNLVSVPRVKLSPINLECKYIQTTSLLVESQQCNSKVIFGHVVGIHIDDSIICNGKIDVTKLRPISRLGYDQYSVIKEFFTMNRPNW